MGEGNVREEKIRCMMSDCDNVGVVSDGEDLAWLGCPYYVFTHTRDLRKLKRTSLSSLILPI